MPSINHFFNPPKSGSIEIDLYLKWVGEVLETITLKGYTGTFEDNTGKTVTVENGIITGVE